jgi:hypothetical protein
MRNKSSVWWRFALAFLILVGVAVTQASHKTRPLVINGHRGEVIVYQIDGKSFVDLESLVRLTNGSISFHEEQIMLTLPAASESTTLLADNHHAANLSLSSEFMREAVQTLASLKDWTDKLAYAATRGVPGDGSRLVVLHDRAAESIRLARVASSSNADHSAFLLLTNEFDIVSNWNDKLIRERKSMDTGKYSMSENALNADEHYQKIVNCGKFLGTMIPSGQFQDDYACH